MKKQLQDYPNLKVLKRNTKIQAEGFYLLSSESSANSLYFETERDIRFAHRQIKKHLSGIMNIVDYLFTPYGWILIVNIKSEAEIQTYCSNRKKISQTIKHALRHKKVHIIISEFIRYAISSIARYINYKSRRKGTVVRENFSRFIFDTIVEAKEIMRSMKKYEVELCNQIKRYKPKLHLWKDHRELLGIENVFLTTNKMREAVKKSINIDNLISISSIKEHVLRKIILQTLATHLSHFSSKNPSKPTFNHIPIPK